MAKKIHGFLPAVAEMPTDRQRLFVAYLMGAMIDLVVLNLFNEYWHKVVVVSFTMSLLAAVLLQALLKATIALEHQVAVFFKDRSGAFNRFLRYLGAWFVLFISKFVILEALSFVFGSTVSFVGAYHGLIVLIVVIITMLIAEEAIVRLYRRLG